MYYLTEEKKYGIFPTIKLTMKRIGGSVHYAQSELNIHVRDSD